jgi:MOSC domain-containing protein YiiM
VQRADDRAGSASSEEPAIATVQLFAGRIRPLPESGRPTGIYKNPVQLPLRIGRQGFDGDQQADRRVHGGPDKAVHLYPSTHYGRLAARFPEFAARFVPGSIGENIATDDLSESDVRIGDVWRLGTARLQVCQPRNPCWKIDERYGGEGIARFIAEQSIAGWYCRVLEPGSVADGDRLELVGKAAAPTLREALDLLAAHRPPFEQLAALIATPGMAGNWRDSIARRLDWLQRHA